MCCDLHSSNQYIRSYPKPYRCHFLCTTSFLNSNNTLHAALIDEVHKLHQGVLYLQNVKEFRGTLVDFIHVHKRSRASPVPDLHITRNYVQVSYADFQPKSAINMESADIISQQPQSKARPLLTETHNTEPQYA
jgi:hypothetical protein